MSRATKDMEAPKHLMQMLGRFRKIERFAEIKLPTDAEEPILAPAVRSGIFEWLAEIRHAPLLDEYGVKPRRSALLYGPPGTGKTTLAHHLAARLGVPLVVVAAERLISSSLGGSGNNVASLFQALTEVDGKCVVLLDEIDGIGARRSSDDQAAAREMVSTLNTLLRYIEQFSGVFIGATNRQADLDPALWRRFSIQMAVDLPGFDERFAILKRYALPLTPDDDDIDMLADATIGASPALLRQLMEGVKRAVAIGPKIGRDVSDPGRVFRSVIASVAMPPEFETPPLWGGAGMDAISQISWPWVRS